MAVMKVADSARDIIPAIIGTPLLHATSPERWLASPNESDIETTTVHLPASDDPTTVEDPLYDPLDDPIYKAIMAWENYTIPHRCYVAIASKPGDIGIVNKTFPVVWCDFKVLVGLNVTAEIKDGSCDGFEEQSSSDLFTRGVASPIFLPEVSEEERMRGEFDHAYCARVDFLYDMTGTGDHARSVLDKRFPMDITYHYKEEIDEETGQIVEEELLSAVLTDEVTKADEQNLDLILGVAFFAGAIFTIALIAITMGKKRKKKNQRLQQMMEEGGVDVEIAPILSPTKEENEIL